MSGRTIAFVSAEPKASRDKREDRAKAKEKSQAERFIEAARQVGVDETGKEFERVLKTIVSTCPKK
jgi:hypothetical protein